MMKDITLGQYYPGQSPIHRLDARMKILLVIALIVCVFLAQTPAAYALCAALVFFAVALSGVPLGRILRGLRPLWFVLLLTAVLNLLYTGGTPLISFWKITVTTEGLYRTGAMLLRVVLLVLGTSLLTYTTSPVSLTDGLDRLLSPLGKIGLPVHEFSLMMTIALRFIPTLVEEVDKISSAQKARGSDLETGRLSQRVRALIPILVPLFLSSFRRADELAVAMECRCYRGGKGKTRLHEQRLAGRDWISAAVLAAGIAGVVLCNVFVRWGALA